MRALVEGKVLVVISVTRNHLREAGRRSVTAAPSARRGRHRQQRHRREGDEQRHRREGDAVDSIASGVKGTPHRVVRQYLRRRRHHIWRVATNHKHRAIVRPCLESRLEPLDTLHCPFAPLVLGSNQAARKVTVRHAHTSRRRALKVELLIQYRLSTRGARKRESEEGHARGSQERGLNRAEQSIKPKEKEETKKLRKTPHSEWPREALEWAGRPATGSSAPSG